VSLVQHRNGSYAKLANGLIATAVLVATAILARRPSARVLALLVGLAAGTVLLAQPALGPVALVAVALIVPIEFGTGTEVMLNPVTLLVPVLIVLWLLANAHRRELRIVHSRTVLPLLLFLASGLISLLAGNATWDPLVPRSANFTIVQLAQWAIFGFSAAAFLLCANTIRSEAALRRLVYVFLLIGGGLAVLSAMVGARTLVNRVATLALIRAPFWILLLAVAGGQLLFNERLGNGWRLVCLACVGAVAVYAFIQEQEAVSNWVGGGTVGLMLVALRFRRLRWPLIIAVVVLALVGILFPAVYNFAGGDVEWQASGGSRLELIEHVVSVTMRDPILGIGPAAYRPYARMQPLAYGYTVWEEPLINSHNNYVDIFSQTGLIGLGLFLWFMGEVAWLCWRLQRRNLTGFSSGYVNGMLASWAGIMVAMVFLDWFLPFVYNVGFPGFQASILVWLFLGGLVALENMARSEGPDSAA
jgi:hypothetical protein